MGQDTLIKKFQEMMENDEPVIDVDTLMSKEERESYDKWLEIFKTLTPFNIPTGLDKVIKDFDLVNNDGVVLLAYIKFFEQRIVEMQGKEDTKSSEEYEGAMFG